MGRTFAVVYAIRIGLDAESRLKPLKTPRYESLLPKIMRNNGSALIFTVSCLIVLGYFAWHGVYGSRGMVRLRASQNQLHRLETTLDRLSAQRMTLDKRAALLRSDSIDADMLDEMARRLLGFADSDDRVIILTPDE